MNCVDKTCVNFKFSRFAVENKLTLSRLSICHRQKYEDFVDFQQKRLRPKSKPLQNSFIVNQKNRPFQFYSILWVS